MKRTPPLADIYHDDGKDISVIASVFSTTYCFKDAGRVHQLDGKVGSINRVDLLVLKHTN